MHLEVGGDFDERHGDRERERGPERRGVGRRRLGGSFLSQGYICFVTGDPTSPAQFLFEIGCTRLRISRR